MSNITSMSDSDKMEREYIKAKIHQYKKEVKELEDYLRNKHALFECHEEEKELEYKKKKLEHFKNRLEEHKNIYQ